MSACVFVYDLFDQLVAYDSIEINRELNSTHEFNKDQHKRKSNTDNKRFLLNILRILERMCK
jgi:hypothetical protein